MRQKLLRDSVLRKIIGSFSFFAPWVFLEDLPTRLECLICDLAPGSDHVLARIALYPPHASISSSLAAGVPKVM
jgi:hypothetical protein